MMLDGKLNVERIIAQSPNCEGFGICESAAWLVGRWPWFLGKRRGEERRGGWKEKEERGRGL